MPEIYVASLADYTAGILHGLWIDLEQVEDVDQLMSAVRLMLHNSPTARVQGYPVEEFAIHDFEGFGKWPVREYTSLEFLMELTEIWNDQRIDFDAFTAFVEDVASGMDYFGGDLQAAAIAFEDSFIGEESWLDYAYRYVEDYHSEVYDNLPEILKYNIDYKAIAEQLESDGDVVQSGTYLFRASW